MFRISNICNQIIPNFGEKMPDNWEVQDTYCNLTRWYTAVDFGGLVGMQSLKNEWSYTSLQESAVYLFISVVLLQQQC